MVVVAFFWLRPLYFSLSAYVSSAHSPKSPNEEWHFEKKEPAMIFKQNGHEINSDLTIIEMVFFVGLFQLLRSDINRAILV